MTWAKITLAVELKYSTIFPIWSLRNCKFLQWICAFENFFNYSGGIALRWFFLLYSNLAGNQFAGNLPYSISTMPNLKYLWVFLHPGLDFTLEYVSLQGINDFFFLAHAETLIITNYKETSVMYFPTFIVCQNCKCFVGIVRWVLILCIKIPHFCCSLCFE